MKEWKGKRVRCLDPAGGPARVGSVGDVLEADLLDGLPVLLIAWDGLDRNRSQRRARGGGAHGEVWGFPDVASVAQCLEIIE